MYPLKAERAFNLKANYLAVRGTWGGGGTDGGKHNIKLVFGLFNFEVIALPFILG